MEINELKDGYGNDFIKAPYIGNREPPKCNADNAQLRDNTFKKVGLSIIATAVIGGLAALIGLGILERNERENEAQRAWLKEKPVHQVYFKRGACVDTEDEKCFKPENRIKINDINSRADWQNINGGHSLNVQPGWYKVRCEDESHKGEWEYLK